METPIDDPDAFFEVGWGWLRGTFAEADPHAVARLACPGADVDYLHGTKWYAESMSVGTGGTVVAWSPRRRRPGRDDEVYLDVPQVALDGLGWNGGTLLAKRLVRTGIRYSRVDAWVNDRRRIVEPAEVLTAFRAGQVVAHTRDSRLVDDSKGGATAYIGARSSDLYLRVYDKERESGDVGAGIRWELEAKGDRAHQVAGRWAAATEPAAELFGIIRGWVDFRDRSHGDHGDRAPLLPWWEELISSATRTTLATPRRYDSIARSAAWLEAQAARALAMVVLARGEDYINHLVALGRSRMTAKDWRVVNDA